MARYPRRRDRPRLIVIACRRRRRCRRATSRVFRLATRFALMAPVYRDERSAAEGRARRVKIVDEPSRVAGRSVHGQWRGDLTELTCNR